MADEAVESSRLVVPFGGPSARLGLVQTGPPSPEVTAVTFAPSRLFVNRENPDTALDSHRDQQ